MKPPGSKYEKKPGPGAYSTFDAPKKGYSMLGRPTSADFKHREASLVPGAGSYDLSKKSTIPSTKFAHSPRIPGSRGNTPGPGAFDVKLKWGGQKDRIRGFSFGNQKRGKNQFVNKSMYEMPGPANYNM